MKSTMCCRCCQSCLEDIYWNCVEEKFCYDETIANYNPEDDEYYHKQNGIVNGIQQNDNNNMPICNQPINRNPSILSSAKIHEDDYRREIQTNVPVLAPEIVAVFENSMIFHDHPPRSNSTLTKSFLPAIHGKDKTETDEEKLLKHLEGVSDAPISIVTTDSDGAIDKKTKFTISPDSSPPPEHLRRSMSPNIFTAIIEEDTTSIHNGNDKGELILRPPTKLAANERNNSNQFLKAPDPYDTTKKKGLRTVQSVPYFSFRPASENDIFSISGTGSQISMTPEIPSISYSTLPKNYEDTPTIEKYKESTSLYSIQAKNMAKVLETDYSMPRFFRGSGLIVGQSTDNVNGGGGGGGGAKDEHQQQSQPVPSKRIEKSKRLKNLRDSLPPLRIHSIRQKFRNEPKNVD